MRMCRKCNFFYADAVSGEEQLGVPGHVFLLKFPESTPDAKYCSLQEYPRLDLALGYAVGGCWALPVFILFRHTCQRFSSLLLGMENLSSTSCMLFFSVARMADNAAKQPLLSGLLDPAPQTDKKDTPNRRRFHHCKSAPLPEYAPGDVNVDDSLPRSQPFFSRLHPSFRKVAIYLTIYLGVGTSCFYVVSPEIGGKKTDGLLDAVYFCIVTMTTVGYGDLVPIGVPAKLLACAFVFTGMALVGLILSEAADYLVERQETALVKALSMREKVGQAEIVKEIETNKVRLKCLMVFALLSVLIVVGTIFLWTVEKLDLVDAFYCVCSTITTLGYGDKSFSTKAGRIFAIFWILISTICLAQFFLYVAEVNTETRQRALVDWVLNRRVTNMDLEAADLDGDGIVGAADFVLYKLKEMGKISQEDISLVMEEFEDLDVDQSGTLSVTDITLAQSAEIGK